MNTIIGGMKFADFVGQTKCTGNKIKLVYDVKNICSVLFFISASK